MLKTGRWGNETIGFATDAWEEHRDQIAAQIDDDITWGAIVGSVLGVAYLDGLRVDAGSERAFTSREQYDFQRISDWVVWTRKRLEARRLSKRLPDQPPAFVYLEMVAGRESECARAVDQLRRSRSDVTIVAPGKFPGWVEFYMPGKRYSEARELLEEQFGTLGYEGYFDFPR